MLILVKHAFFLGQVITIEWGFLFSSNFCCIILIRVLVEWIDKSFKSLYLEKIMGKNTFSIVTATIFNCFLNRQFIPLVHVFAPRSENFKWIACPMYEILPAQFYYLYKTHLKDHIALFPKIFRFFLNRLCRICVF